MRRTFSLLGLLVGMATLSQTSDTEARINDGLSHENPWAICGEATRRTESREGIPQHLLTAISLAESGRWSKDRSASVAWPWTVTSGGPGRFFPNMSSAIAHVEKLQKQGVSNIDVGCMQINLHFHGHAFPSLEHAFFPEENTAYAADFLKRLFNEKKSWTAASGSYHSRTPERHRYYRGKVARFWAKLREAGGLAQQNESLTAEITASLPEKGAKAPPPSWTTPSKQAPVKQAKTDADIDAEAEATAPSGLRYIDQDRTDRLNRSLADRKRERRVAAFARGSEQLRQAGIRLEQIRAYRDRGQALQEQQVQRVMQKARRDLEKKQRRLEAEHRDREVSFAAKRREQLTRWRETGSLNELR